MEVIAIDSPQFALSWQLFGRCPYIYARKRSMKMAHSPENGLLSAGAAVR